MPSMARRPCRGELAPDEEFPAGDHPAWKPTPEVRTARLTRRRVSLFFDAATAQVRWDGIPGGRMMPRSGAQMPT